MQHQFSNQVLCERRLAAVGQLKPGKVVGYIPAFASLMFGGVSVCSARLISLEFSSTRINRKVTKLLWNNSRKVCSEYLNAWVYLSADFNNFKCNVFSFSITVQPE